MSFMVNSHRFGGGFTDPSDIPIMKIWCESDVGLFSDAAGTTPQSTNGGTVRHWTNQMGSNNLTRASGNSPTLDTGTTLNGLSTLHFTSATLQCFDLPAAVFASDTAGELILVVKKDADPAASSPTSGFLFLGTASIQSHYPFTDGVVYDAFATSTNKTVGNLAQNLAAWHVYNPRSAANDWELLVNNASVFSTASNAVTWPAAPLLGVSSALGAFTGSEMRVAAMYYGGGSRYFTPSERAFMYSWINAKYGI